MDQSKPAKAGLETSPKRKSRKSILVEENKQLFEQVKSKLFLCFYSIEDFYWKSFASSTLKDGIQCSQVFHFATGLFLQLLKKCEEVDGTQDIKKGTAKARKHFQCAQIEFISSQEFKNTIQTSLAKVSRECVWGHLGELVKQLKLYKVR